MKKFLTPQVLVTIALVQATVAVLGSLYFSNIQLYVPCDFCWWQRIMLYPQVLLLGVALWQKDWRIYRYSLPLLSIGWLISLYHNYIYYNANFFHPVSVNTPCGISGISCTTRYIEYFGFVSIPLLSLLAFSVMIGCMVLLRYTLKKKNTKS